MSSLEKHVLLSVVDTYAITLDGESQHINYIDKYRVGMTNTTMPKWLQYEKRKQRKPYHYLHVCTSMTTRAPYKNMTLGYSTTTQLSSFLNTLMIQYII